MKKQYTDGTTLTHYFPAEGEEHAWLLGRITRIGDGAFANCPDLKCIHLPEEVTEIGDHAFERCMNLREIRIPAGVRSIGAHAFHFCIQLEQLDLPDHLEALGEGVFCGCGRLGHLTIPMRLRTCGADLFQHCGSLRTLTLTEPTLDGRQVYPLNTDYQPDPIYRLVNRAAAGHPCESHNSLFDIWLEHHIPALEANLRYHAKTYLERDLEQEYFGEIALRFQLDLIPPELLREHREHPCVRKAMEQLFGLYANAGDFDGLRMLREEALLDSVCVGQCIPVAQEHVPEEVPELISYRWRVLGEGEEPADTLKL